MTYWLLCLTLLSFLNCIVSFLTLKKLIFLNSDSHDHEADHLEQRQDIHEILNHRLLDLQHRRYAPPQKIKKV